VAADGSAAPPAPGPEPEADGAGTDAYVPGSGSRRQWPTGQAITNALPTTRLSGIVPPPGLSVW
jgi:hypothetical protein